MPGISIVFSCDTLPCDKIKRSCREMQHKDNYEVTQVFQKDTVVISFSGYEGYPSHRYEDENVLILFEGLVYNKSDQEINNLLRKIADEYNQRKPYKRRIVELIENSDGDYIGLIYFKSDEAIIIFNDRWGRLPAFFFAGDGIFAFSREIKFLLHWIPCIEFDPIAMAEFLIYHYNLGEKTLVKGITRFRPASFLEAKSSDDQICVTKEALLPVNFEMIDLNATRNEVIKQCVKLFRESLSARVRKTRERGLHIVADLSGGHDTRAIFGSLCQMGVPFTPCTDVLTEVDESRFARQLADSYGKMLCRFSSSHPVDDFSILRNITYLTDCAVNGWIAVSRYYDSLEREKSFAAPTAHFMGLGGAFLRHPYRLKKNYPSLIAILEDAAYSTLLPPLSALAITKLNMKEFRKNLEREVARFPEQEDADKVKHLYFEYCNKAVNAGEDRHRMFSWTVQPYWGNNLFAFEIKNVPSKMISYKFFIDFLRALDPKLLETPIYSARARSDFRLDSRVGATLYEAKMYTQEMLVNNRYVFNLYKWAIRKLDKSPKKCALVDEVRRTFQDKFVSLQFDGAAIEVFLLQSPRALEVYQLLTLMSYVAEVGRRFGQKVKHKE